MPIFKNYIFESIQICFWIFSEDDELTAEQLIEKENEERFSKYHPNKLAEVLMVRKMLKKLLPGSKILYKDCGEPYLSPNNYNISISHSFPMVSIAISKNRIGIDLEKVKEKIIRIKDKFILNEKSFIPNDNEEKYLTAIWCVKEALYKIHHSKHWSLKKHYEVMPFVLSDNIEVDCRVYDEVAEDFFKAKITFFDDYCFAVVEEY